MKGQEEVGVATRVRGVCCALKFNHSYIKYRWIPVSSHIFNKLSSVCKRSPFSLKRTPSEASISSFSLYRFPVLWSLPHSPKNPPINRLEAMTR